MLPYPKIEPTGRLNGNRAVFRLLEDFRLTITLPWYAASWHIPAGTETDFASIPRWMQPWIPPVDPRIMVAALIHDELYRRSCMPVRATNLGTGDGEMCSGHTAHHHSRFYADALFRELMCLYRAPWWMRVAAFYGVRFAGWLYWNSGKGTICQ